MCENKNKNPLVLTPSKSCEKNENKRRFQFVTRRFNLRFYLSLLFLKIRL